MRNTELSLADIPTDALVRVESDGLNLLVIRSNGCLFAYLDKCPHAFWPLSQGTLNNAVLECPGHGWEFDVQTGRCLNAPGYCLTPIAVTIAGDTVCFESPDPDARNSAKQDLRDSVSTALS
jgi:nitrite reductase (NADH) small subunit